MRPAKKLTKYGSWAAVTGATDGIGRAYCDELAKQGVNCILGDDLSNVTLRCAHYRLALQQHLSSSVSSHSLGFRHNVSLSTCCLHNQL
jgi:NAD(P)-dependent dehydrogenase (short-subunit alcohol dehydrogenase family)